MKKLFSLLFIAVIAAGFFTLPALKALRSELKYKVRIDILNKNFNRKEIFIFKNSALREVRWIEHDEFILNDEMFDVLKTETVQGELYLYCLKDKKENPVRQIQVFVVNNFHKKPLKAKFNSCRLTFNKSSHSVFINEIGLILSLRSVIHEKKERKYYSFSFKDHVLDVHEIPPEFYC